MQISQRPLVGQIHALCIVPPPVCFPMVGCHNIPGVPCVIDDSDLNPINLAKKLIGLPYGDIIKALDRLPTQEACRVVGDLVGNLDPSDLIKLGSRYGCKLAEIPGGGGGNSPTNTPVPRSSGDNCSEYVDQLRGRNALETYSICRSSCRSEENEASSSYTCSSGKCCVGKILSSVTTTPGVEATTTPVPTQPGGGPPGGGGYVPPAAPTPPTDGPGYCGDSKPTLETMVPIPVAGDLCAKGSAFWVNRGARGSDISGYDDYCNYQNNTLRYFYKCPSASSTSPTPTPTVYVPKQNGQACNPIQGPWQCQAGSVCQATCSPASASCTTGVCAVIPTPPPQQSPGAGCPQFSPTQGMSCNGPENTVSNCCQVGKNLVCKLFNYAANGQPTFACQDAGSSAPPGTNPPVNTPTPVSTGSTCPDAVPGTNIHQVCSQNTCGSNVPNPSGNDACSNFYGTGYVCCQLPANTGPAGSSCNTPNRLCDPTKNSGTDGQNSQCSGCGGYCVGTGSSAYCTNKYPPAS